MRIYSTSSAAIKRAVAEAESAALGDYLDSAATAGDGFLASDLTRIEVCRALLRLPGLTARQLADGIDNATGDIAFEPISPDVVALALRIKPADLRTLDAIHLASATLLEADIVLVIDSRMAEAATADGLAVLAPGAASPSTAETEPVVRRARRAAR